MNSMKITKQHKNILPGSMIFLGLLLSACGGNFSQGELLEDDKVITRDQKQSYEGKRVSFQGYFEVPDSDIWEGRGVTEQTITIINKPCTDKEDAESVTSVSLPLNSLYKNAMDIPTSFHEGNVYIITNDKERLRCRDKIKVSGTVEYAKNWKPVELVDVKMDKKGNVTRTPYNSYSYSLKDVRIDKAN